MSFLISNPKRLQRAVLTEAVPALPSLAETYFATVRKVLASGWALLLQAIATPNKTRTMMITDKIALAEKSLLVIANIEGKRFLIGATPSGMTLLAELDTADGESCRRQSRKASVTSRRGKKVPVAEESVA